MKIRTSENPHSFQEILFRALNAYSLQGLLMNSHHEFTAAVEAVEYEPGDDETVIPFEEDSVWARYILAESLGIPFYIVCYLNGLFRINRVVIVNGKITLYPECLLTNDKFARWWSELKGTVQVKQLNNGGESRLSNTVFDRVLRLYGLEWGGNIDGFVLSNNNQRVRFIIDNISVSSSLYNDFANPARYFNSPNPRHGPRYDGWYAAVKLANTLNVPHALFTIDKRNPYSEHIGFTIISQLTPRGIYYSNDRKPNENVIEGLSNIVRVVNQTVREAAPPILVERDDFI